MTTINRRDFLKGCCAAAATSGLAPTAFAAAFWRRKFIATV